MSNAVNVMFTAMSSSLRNWGEMTLAPAAQGVDFKACCLKSKRYDGSLRDYYF